MRRAASTIVLCLAIATAGCTAQAAPSPSGASGAPTDPGSQADPAAPTVTIEGLGDDALVNAEEAKSARLVVTANIEAVDLRVFVDDELWGMAGTAPTQATTSPSPTAPTEPTAEATSPDTDSSQTPGAGPSQASDADVPPSPDTDPSESPAATAPAHPEPTATIDPDASTLTWEPGALAQLSDGDHQVRVVLVADAADDPIEQVADFTLDTKGPKLQVDQPIEATERDAPLEVSFTTGSKATVAAPAGTLDAEAGTLTFESAPAEVTLTATDPAGNVTEVVSPVIVAHPGMRAVHTTAYAWDYEPKRTAIIDLIEAGLIDTVQLDVKDEAGEISYDSDVELANTIGADETHNSFDVTAALQTLHDLDVRVVGRLVVYKDPILGNWAWNNGNRDWVTQQPDGQPFTGSYGDYAFTNPANKKVQQYNVDVALEAADLGFDEILYDYIRRPDGYLEDMVFPGLGDRTPEEAVIEMMATAYPQLRERDVWVGASVFGIAITRPHEIAQDIPGMAPYVDYIAPMVYPDHWAAGEYDLSAPWSSPYEIVQQSLADFQEVLEPTGTKVIPWLASFKLSGDTTVDYVTSQIDATVDATGEEWFLLWSPSANYLPDSLDPIGPDGP